MRLFSENFFDSEILWVEAALLQAWVVRQVYAACKCAAWVGLGPVISFLIVQTLKSKLSRSRLLVPMGNLCL